MPGESSDPLASMGGLARRRASAAAPNLGQYAQGIAHVVGERSVGL
jgi:hypothetical protein